MAEVASISMRGDLRRVCLIICGCVVILIIFFGYAKQSQSGSATTNHFKDTSSPHIRKHKMFHVIHEGKTTIEPRFGTTKQTGVNTTTGTETIYARKLVANTSAKTRKTSSMKLEVNSTAKIKTKQEVNTKAELDFGRSFLQKQSLTRHTTTSINNRLNTTRSNLADTDTGSDIISSVTDKQGHIADGRTTRDFGELFNNGTARTTRPGAQLQDQHKLPLPDVTAEPSTKFQSNKNNSLYSLSEAEIQTILKSELHAANTTIAPEAEMASQFRSVGKTILIIGYHRTGSTLLGTTFKISPGTFYLFEPLSRLGAGTHLTFINGTRMCNLPEQYLMTEARVLHALLSCNLYQLPLTLLISRNHVRQKDSLEQTAYCLRRYMSHIVRGAETNFDGNHINTSNSVIDAFSVALSGMRNADAVVTGIVTRCLKPAIDTCLKAPVRVYKFIRLRMSKIKNILRDTTDISFIHLFRDPRGNIPSQANLNIPRVLNMQHADLRDKQLSVQRTAYFKEFIYIANKYCSEVRTDIAYVHNFTQQYGYRIRMVLYEKFAMAPLTTVRELYAFAGLPFLNLTEDYVWQLTLSGQRETCSYCVERGNSANSAFRWRKTIYSTQLLIIDELCRDLYPVVGLRQLRHLSDVRNMSVPIFYLKL